MIVVILKGGLGNQMFQYALGLFLSKKYHVPLKLDATFLNDRTPRPHFTFRAYALDIFNLEPNFTFLSRLSFLLPLPILWLGLSQIKSRLLSILGIRPYVRQKNDAFDASLFDRGGNITVDGYFQSERYFAEAMPEVQNAFGFKEELPSELQSIAHRMENEESVCVHVRRGDYVSDSVVASSLGFIGAEFFDRALAELQKTKTISRIYLFSDDIPWCRANLSFGDLPVVYEDEFPSKTSGQTFQLMTHAKHFIIGNSTYSWWAAWVGTREANSGMVIAPALWARAEGIAGHDILPNQWIRI